MSGNTINDHGVMTAEVTMPRMGVWHADVESDGTAALAGSVALIIEGVAFQGTVVPGRSGLSGGRVLTKLAGGKGKLATVLASKNYASGATIRIVVADVLRETGETLSGTAQTAVLATFLGKWERSEGPASGSLTEALDAAGASWRVLRDGTVWVGVDSYPETTVDHVLEDEDWVKGVLDIAPSKPDLVPAVTFHGQRISYVIHKLRPEALRTEAYIVDSPGNALERIFGGVRRQIDYSRKYSARVVSQNSDGTLSVVVDNQRLRGSGIDKVEIRTGFPGSVKVAAGARCLVGFDGGDPTKPYAEGWDGTAHEEIQIGTGTLPAARQGDMVAISLTPQNIIQLAACFLPAAVGVPPTPLPTIVTAAGIPGAPLVPPITAYGLVSSGNPKIKE